MISTRSLRRGLESIGIMERRNETLRGALAGAMGGLVASWVMNQFQSAWSAISKRWSKGQEQSGGESEQRWAPRFREEQEHEAAQREQQRQQQQSGEEEEATTRTAEAVAEPILQRPLTQEEKKTAGPIVHYVYGTLIGGVYGALCENMPITEIGFGTAYGAAVWLLGDEVMVPLLKLGKPPTQVPLSMHAYALASHLVYGSTLEAVRRGMRAFI